MQKSGRAGWAIAFAALVCFILGVACGAGIRFGALRSHVGRLESEVAFLSSQLATARQQLEMKQVAVEVVSTTTALVGVQAAKMTLNGFIAGVITACLVRPIRQYLQPIIARKLKWRHSGQ